MNSANIGQIIQNAMELFSSHHNCCESVALAVSEYYGKPHDLIQQITTPFGGGIGGTRDACGAFLGGVIAVGAVLGRTSADDLDRKWAVGKLAAEYREKFLEQMKTTNCGLIRGDRPDETLHDTVCGDAVRVAVKAAVEAIEQGKVDGL